MASGEEPPFDPDYDTPTRQPIANIQAEQAVLGAILTDPTLATTLHTHLNPEDFWRPAHETIWNTIQTLTQTGGTPDPITVAAQLNGQLTPLGGPTYLTDLMAACPIPNQATTYAKIVRDAARLRNASNAVTRLQQTINKGATLDDVDTTLANLIDTIDENFLRFGPREKNTTAWAPLNLEPVLNGEEIDPPPTLLTRDDGQHLLYKGAIHTLSGEPSSGKTWMTLIAATQQLNQGNNVTMVDFEDRASRVIGRLLALGAHPQNIRQHFRYIRPHNPLDTNSRTDLDHATHGSTLVILDGVTEAMTLHGLEPNTNSDVARFYDLLPRHIADTTGAAVTLIDHVVKDTEKQGRWGIGGQHKLAGIDGVAYLVKAIEPFGRGKTGRARITVSKDRPGYIEEIALGRTVAELHLDATNINCLQYTLQPPNDLPTDQAGNMRPTHLMERISRYIEITPGLGKRELLDGRIRGKRTYLNRALDRLTQEGFIEVSTGPNRKQSHRTITPYREEHDNHENEPS